MEYLVSILLNIVGNLLTPSAKRLLRWKEPEERPTDLPNVVDPPRAPGSAEDKEAIRARNRARLDTLLTVLGVHTATLVSLWAAIYLPLSMETWGKPELALAATRLTWLADFVLPQEGYMQVSIAIALLLYVPIWLLAQQIARLLAVAIDQVSQVSPARYAGLLVLCFMALSFGVAGHWVYLLDPSKTYLGALATPLLFLVLGGGLAAGQRRR